MKYSKKSCRKIWNGLSITIKVFPHIQHCYEIVSKNACLQLTNESAELKLLKIDIQRAQQTSSRMQKQKKADMIERSIDEKSSLLKISEFIEMEQDQSELLVLIDQMHIGETQF